MYGFWARLKTPAVGATYVVTSKIPINPTLAGNKC
jgi:hypothetical protein